jgi:hypothetical protein
MISSRSEVHIIQSLLEAAELSAGKLHLKYALTNMV